MKPPKNAVYLFPVEIRALKDPKSAPPGALQNLKLLGLI